MSHPPPRGPLSRTQPAQPSKAALAGLPSQSGCRGREQEPEDGRERKSED